MTLDKTRQVKLVESERHHHERLPQLAQNSSGLYATGTATTNSQSKQNT